VQTDGENSRQAAWIFRVAGLFRVAGVLGLPADLGSFPFAFFLFFGFFGLFPEGRMSHALPDIIEHFGNADAVPQLPERCLSRKAGIVRCCLE